ncbi:MAG: IclR family transcriptional regulator [Candidatus Binatia bacterium]
MLKLTNLKTKPKSGTQPLTSLAKGLKLLLSLRDSSKPMSLTEISRNFGLNKVSALRILLTLEQHRFVEKNLQDKKYQIGSNAFYVGSGFIAGGKRDKILEAMGKLVHDLKHTITLGVLDGSSVLFIERVDGTERVKVTVDIGSRVPAHSSAAGKALLAGLSDTEIIKRFKPHHLKSAASAKPISVKQILINIAKVRESGFAVNNEESTPGLIAVAVPIKSVMGEHVAALGAAFPAGTLKNKEEQKKVSIRLQQAADEISSLGVRNSREISNVAG